jgi:hypothetical protein
MLEPWAEISERLRRNFSTDFQSLTPSGFNLPDNDRDKFRGTWFGVRSIAELPV